MDLITINENGNAILDTQAINALAEYERILSYIGEKEKSLKSMIMEEMKKHNIIKIDMDEIKISYVAPYTKEKFETKAFRAQYPDVYDEFVTMSSVKEQIKITLPKE